MSPAPRTRTGPHELVLDPELIRAFAEATGDDAPAYREGRAVPPTLLATLAYEPQAASMGELLDPSIMETMVSGVHGQHELVLLRPLEPGERLTGWVEAYSLKPARSNLRVTFRHPAYDEDGELVAEQFWTTVLLGTTAEAEGPDLPDYSMAEVDRSVPAAEGSVHIDATMVQRYAEVSRDFSEHHFSLEAAQRSGQPEVFLHGLCTMALAARAAVACVADGDPRRIRRFAVRFASPAFLDRDLVTRFYTAPGGFSFEGSCGELPALRNGWVELG
jgi:acyl dehydratase